MPRFVEGCFMKPCLIHCSYHKCLTAYYSRVMDVLYNHLMPWGNGFRHFNSFIDHFYDHLGQYKIISVNNHLLDFRRLSNYRITRFIRDPRDLVVSGYLYHKQAIEDWSRIIGPEEEAWETVNGHVPPGMKRTDSYASYLQRLSQDEGLIAEIDFRRHHFKTMATWPSDNPDIMILRYEDIIGDERRAFQTLFSFYDLPWLEKKIGGCLAGMYAAHRFRQTPSPHIRNPEPGQWRRHFTAKVNDYFNENYGDLLITLGYPMDNLVES